MKVYKSEFYGKCPVCGEPITLEVALVDMGTYKPIHIHMECRKCKTEIAV